MTPSLVIEHFAPFGQGCTVIIPSKHWARFPSAQHCAAVDGQEVFGTRSHGFWEATWSENTRARVKIVIKHMFEVGFRREALIGRLRYDCSRPELAIVVGTCQFGFTKIGDDSYYFSGNSTWINIPTFLDHICKLAATPYRLYIFMGDREARKNWRSATLLAVTLWNAKQQGGHRLLSTWRQSTNNSY